MVSILLFVTLFSVSFAFSTIDFTPFQLILEKSAVIVPISLSLLLFFIGGVCTIEYLRRHEIFVSLSESECDYTKSVRLVMAVCFGTKNQNPM